MDNHDKKESDNIQAIKKWDPYNPGFPMQYFSMNVDSKINEAEKIVDSIYDVVVKETTNLSIALEESKPGFRLVVDTPKDVLKAIEEGKVKLSTDRKGNIHAQIRRADGKLDKKLPIKKEDIEENSLEVASALQLKQIQEQLVELSKQIVDINYSVQDILKGQQNDRIGLYYGAASLIAESAQIKNEPFQEILMVQGIGALSEAIFQLALKFKDDIRFLSNKEYEKARGKRVKIIEEKMNDINQAFAYIHQGMILKAAVYCRLNEFSAMTTVLEEYSRFIEYNVKPNAGLLSQLDSNDTGLKTGIWKSRAVLSFDSINLNNLLENTKETYYEKSSVN